jgi:hypothetical protein
MDVKNPSPIQDLTLEDLIDYLEYITQSEHLIIAIQQLHELERLQSELQRPWARFKAFIDSPGLVPPEPIQEVSGEEPSESSQSSLEETRPDPPTDLQPVPAVLTDQTTGVEGAVPTALASSTLLASSTSYCCVITAPGRTTRRVTYHTDRIYAKAACQRLALAYDPNRTGTLHDGACS